MELKEWTHRYSYKMELPNFVPRVGNVLTGTVQVSREYSDDEVEALAKEMSHGIFNNAKLVEVRLVEVRNTPTPSNTAGKPQPQAVGLGGMLGLVPERGTAGELEAGRKPGV